MRYLWTGAIDKKRVFPTPSPNWQREEYERLMGCPPPENQDSWQFEYGQNHKTKAGKAAFAAFAQG